MVATVTKRIDKNPYKVQTEKMKVVTRSIKGRDLPPWFANQPIRKPSPNTTPMHRTPPTYSETKNSSIKSCDVPR